MQESPEQDEQSKPKDSEEDTIKHNLRLLTLKFIGRGTEELDQETRVDLAALHTLESMLEDNKISTGIKIEYDTASGKIGVEDMPYHIGERSRLNSWLVTSRQHPGYKNILLYQPGDMLTPQQYDAVMMGEKVPVPDDRRILPERIMPEYPRLAGPSEPWGYSQFTDNASGDLVILKTIQQFNEKFGPPR